MRGSYEDEDGKWYYLGPLHFQVYWSWPYFWRLIPHKHVPLRAGESTCKRCLLRRAKKKKTVIRDPWNGEKVKV